MSDEHDHSHHDHDHKHDHDHDHDHDHGHEHPAPAPGDTVVQEDASSQALAEALRSSFGIVKVIMVLLVVVFICSGFFQVKQGQNAIRLHLGAPVMQGKDALLGPGLHWAWPYPIDYVTNIPSSQLITVRSSTAWYNVTPEQEALGQEPQGGLSLNPAVDGYAITGDGNIIHTRAFLTYRIDDPVRYVFDFVNASNSVRDALDNALLDTAARFKVDDVLTRDITRFQDEVSARVTELIQLEKLPVVVESCQVDSVPPLSLKVAFNSVLTAVLERDKAMSDAKSYENQALSKAASDAASRTNSAQAERILLVESVQAEAKRFSDLLPHYQENPKLFANILLTEKLGQVMTNVEDKIYLPERADGKTRELRLQLSREPQKAPTNQ
jgi:modulator of FtsH protease HflK